MREQTAKEKKACSGLLLKVNQIGTVTESIKACNMAHEEGWGEVQACAKGAAARRSAHVCALHRKALQFPHHPTRQRRTWTGAVGA